MRGELLNQNLNFDTSKVTKMKSMFWNTISFNKPLEFNTRLVEDMRYMFQGSVRNTQVYDFNGESLVQPPNDNPISWIAPDSNVTINIHRLSHKNSNNNEEYLECGSQNVRCFTLKTHTSPLGDLTSTSPHCTVHGSTGSLEYIDLEFNISDLSHALYRCNELKGVTFYPVNSIQAESTRYMFSYATQFNGAVDLDTSQVTNMENMFELASNFNHELNFNTSNVRSMKQMFLSTSFDQPLNFDTSQVTDMGGMFGMYQTQGANNRQVYNLDGRSLDTTISGHSPIYLINYNQANVTINIHRLAKKNGNENSNQFGECSTYTAPTNVRCFTLQTHSSPLGLNVTSPYCEKDGYELEYIDLEFDTPALNNVFRSCGSLLEVAFYPVGSTQATDTRDMFTDALLFNGLVDLDTSQVTRMENMFWSAEKFNKELNFNTSNVRNMRGMFAKAYEFNKPLNFDTSQVTLMESMFFMSSNNASTNTQVYNFDGSSLKTYDVGTITYDPLGTIALNAPTVTINIHRLAKKNGNEDANEFGECSTVSNVRCFTLQTHSTSCPRCYSPYCKKREKIWRMSLRV